MIGEDKDPNRDSPIQPFNHSTIQRSVCFIAGETSGDQNAAGVCAAVRRLAPEVQLFGAAGPQMRAAGCDAVADLTQLAVVGLVEVAKHYFEFRKIFYHLLDEVARRQPGAVVLTDYPGFNLRFMKALRARGYRGKIIYFISPQFWAWAPWRARVVERCCDLMLTLFAFEKDWYLRRAPGLRVEFVGHPLVDRIRGKGDRFQRSEKTLAVLPGSRKREVQVHWPILRDAALRTFGKEQVEVMVLAASDEIHGWLESEIKREPQKIFVVSRDPERTLCQVTMALTASGTATLECACWGCPMIVVYRVAWPTYFLARTFIRVPWIAMPNILVAKQIVPEFVQHKATPQAIAATALDLLRHPEKRKQQRAELAEVVKKLGPPGASERAARAILAEIL